MKQQTRDFTAIFAVAIYFFITLMACIIGLNKDIKSISATSVAISHKVEQVQATSTPEDIYKQSLLGNPEEWAVYFESIAHCANNNPGNLEFRHQHWAKKCGRWACFNTTEAGVIALVRQLALDIERGDNLRTFLKDYAPSHENDTNGYIKFVEREVGITESDWIGKPDFIKFLKAIIKKEC